MDCVNSSVILPAIRPGQEERDCTNIATRMFLEKPQKWYMAGHIFGEKDYVPSDTVKSISQSIVNKTGYKN